LLDNGGLIARRIIDLQDPDENMGAMFLRGTLWRLYEKVGDGTATAAVIFQTVYNQGLRYIAAGGNAMLLRRHLEEGLKAIFEALDEMVTPVEGKEMLRQVARSVCYDEELAEIMGDIFNLIGEYGILQIRGGRSRTVEKEYIEGSFWSGGLYSKDMILDINKQRTQFIDASILLSDLELDEPEQLVPVLQAVAEAQIPNLVIMANKVSDRVMGLLAVSQKQSKARMVAVKVPGMRLDEQMNALEDLAVLTGGKTFIKAAGDTFKTLSAESFGKARKIWADMNYLGVSGGKGDPIGRREQIEKLRRGYLLAEEADQRTKLRERIGRLYSGAAVIWMGGMAETEIETRKELAQRTSDTMRGAIEKGIVTGGGVSLIACQPALRQKMGGSADSDIQAAYRILQAALEAPFRAILANAGYSSGAILSRLEQAGAGYVFDVQKGEIVPASESGVYDVAAVQKEAVYSGIQGAALALTIDTVIHRRKPPISTEPE
jgi:chaperonin GroEL